MIQNDGGVSVGEDLELFEAFKTVLNQVSSERPKVIIETGTYHGLGTTALAINAINECRGDSAVKKMPHIITMEANENNYKIARENLKDCPFIEVVHGCSVDLEEALNFIESDEVLQNINDYPSIKIDSMDPIPFYSEEVKGQLFAFGYGSVGDDNLLFDYISKYRDKTPMFILDSCGGIGFLEFQTVMDLMGSNKFYVFLHDINHVKHFRSYAYIMHNMESWKIVDEKENEWIVAKRMKIRRKK